MAEILVVDDEIGIRELLSEILGDEGHSVLLADCAQQARKVRDENPLDLVLLDIWMPDTDGVTLLKEWAAGGKLTMPVIMMSGHATIDTAVEATRIGALDFLEKPIALQKLLKAVEQGLARGKAARLQAQTEARLASVPEVVPLPRPPAPEPLAGATVEFRPVAAQPGAAFLPTTGGAPVSGQPGAAIALRDLPLDLPLREARDAFERAYFEHHLAREMGSMTRVAEKTGLERTHLYRKLKQLGIDLSRGIWRRNQSH
ncbi:response regulator [Quisquiliibacterium transsilvanicum]|uniref:DNA-binding NtrC family response regulator n=1 Tax=Quisquiliibacterium transsilvanicum TaxID=1549638 RepID=A0A7W8M9F7_9BURK|nr:response regulator [Quisquiliibacterium transsilvanicum]MBB5272833.1 DNA-binding NtrC family response regulator [Quisquiliibacterium transsilvanicum]